MQKIVNGVVLGASPGELDFVPVENQLHLLDVERRLGVIVCLIQRVFSFIIKMQYSEYWVKLNKTLSIMIHQYRSLTFV